MASFFGEVLPPRSRIIDDEDLDAMEEKNLLIVCEGKLPSIYSQLCSSESQMCGDLLAKSFNQDVSIGKIYRGNDWTVVTCEQDLKQQEYLNLANTVLGLADVGCKIICLTARHISEYRVEESDQDETVTRSLSSSSFPEPEPAKKLEVPNILTGLSAGVLSISVVKGFPCLLLVNYVDVLTADSISLQGFQNIHKLKIVQECSLQKPNIAEALKTKQLHKNSNHLGREPLIFIMASPGEPTQLVQIQKLFQTQLRNEQRRHNSGRASEKRPYAQRLTFDETLDESGNASKMARMNSFNDLSSRRIMNNDNTKVITELEEKNKALEERLKLLTAENAGSLARQAKLENRIKLNEVDMKKSTIEFEHKLEKATRLYKSELDRVNELKYKLKHLEDTKLDRDERETETRRQSLDRFDVLENKVKRLRDERSKLESQNERLETQLRNRADINPIAFSTKMQNYEGSIGELRQKCAEYEERNKLLANRLEAVQQSATENKENKEALARSKLIIEKLECELAANRDSFIQRKAMSQKLDQFSHLEKENQSLRNINELHLKTQENVDLLKEQILNLTAERDRAETRAKDKAVLQADLQALRDEIEEWKDLVTRIATPEERQRIVSCGIQTARNVFKNLQAREVDLVAENSRIQAELNDANALIEKGKEILTKKGNDLLQVKGEQADQTKLVKKLQRKLLLVSKERDTSRAILDSMEKELTVSGSSWEQSRIEGLEKTLEEYKAMVDMLMEKDTGNSPSGGKSYEDKVAQVQELEKRNQELYRTIKTLEEEIQNKDDMKQSFEQAEILLKEKEELLERVEQLELQSEQRAIKGDFNPDETRVLHFASNPFDNAVKRREVDLEALKTENAALKARIELLEEGQTKDLTMMVGHKLEEGSSSAEVEQLKEKLSSSELKNQRIVELFQKTSKEFRNFIAQTTGFRVDRIKDATYKMIPIYVEKDKYLLFSLSEENGVQLLETAFSTELERLMEKHLEQDNSIPMFMASLIRDLFRKQQRDMETETEEEAESQDGEETEHSEEEGDGEGNSEGDGEGHSEGEGEVEDEGEGGNSSDVICVDDD